MSRIPFPHDQEVPKDLYIAIQDCLIHGVRLTPTHEEILSLLAGPLSFLSMFLRLPFHLVLP